MRPDLKGRVETQAGRETQVGTGEETPENSKCTAGGPASWEGPSSTAGCVGLQPQASAHRTSQDHTKMLTQSPSADSRLERSL